MVALDSRGGHLWTRRGVLGGVNVSSHKAELRALLEALKVCSGTVRIHVNNQAVVDGVRGGKEMCTYAKATDADLWRAVWDELDIVRARGSVDVLKVKAHTTWLDVVAQAHLAERPVWQLARRQCSKSVCAVFREPDACKELQR